MSEENKMAVAVAPATVLGGSGGDEWSGFLAVVAANNWAEAVAFVERVARLPERRPSDKLEVARVMRGQWDADGVAAVERIFAKVEAEETAAAERARQEAKAKAEAADVVELSGIRALRRTRDPQVFGIATRAEPKADVRPALKAAVAQEVQQRYAPPTTEQEEETHKIGRDDEVISDGRFLDRVASPAPKIALRLPGIAGEIQDHYLRTAMQPSEIMSLAPAIMVPTALVCANVFGPSGPKGCSLHRYLIVLGPTSSGKQALIDLVKECLAEAGAKKLIGPNRFKSGHGLVRWVSENPTSLCVQDEFGKLLSKIGNQNANQSELEINERMRELWGLGPESIYNGPVGASEGDDMQTVVEPHLNILGVGVREEFYSVCKVTDQVNGFLNRLDILEEPRMLRPRDVGRVQFPFSLKTQLCKLGAIKRRQLPWTRGAKEIWDAELDRVYSETDERKIKLWARTPEKIVMAGTVFACCRFAKQVERSDMEAAQAFLRLSDEVFKRGIDEAEKKKVLDYAELKVEIERRTLADFANRATEFQLKNSFRHNTKFKNAVADALRDMVESGTLTTSVVKTNGRSKTVHSVVDQS